MRFVVRNSILLIAFVSRRASCRMSSSTTPRIKPPALRPGDTVGIVAPASNVKRADLEAGCEALRRAGYRPRFLDYIIFEENKISGSV
jgi:hypothetical protein